MDTFFLKTILLWTCFLRISAGNNGKWNQGIRDIQNFPNRCDPIFFRANTQPDSSQFQSVCFQKNIFNGSTQINVGVSRSGALSAIAGNEGEQKILKTSTLLFTVLTTCVILSVEQRKGKPFKGGLLYEYK